MSQLRIPSFDDTYVTHLNNWAREQTNRVDSHAADIKGMQVLLQRLFEKNPDLKKP